MAVNIEKYLPDRIRELKEALSLCQSEDPEFDDVEAVRTKWEANRFPLEADQEGIRRFELMLDLKPQDGDTLEDRRLRVVAKLNSRVPYSEIQLRRMLAAITGWDEYELQIIGYELFLWVSLKSYTKLSIIYDMLLEVVPENMWITLVEAMQFVSGIYAIAQKQKTWIGVLPWQERELTDDPDVWIAGAQWQKDPVSILPWQRHGMDFGPQLTPSAQKQRLTVTLFPPQAKGADSAARTATRVWMTARQVISVRAGQEPYWRYIYE